MTHWPIWLSLNFAHATGQPNKSYVHTRNKKHTKKSGDICSAELKHQQQITSFAYA